MAFSYYQWKEGGRPLELFKIFGTIALKGKDEFGKDVDESTKKGNALSESIGNGMQKAAKIATTALTAIGAAVATLTTQAVKSYAEYEQLVGGVETLFKGSSQKVQEYAANAYKTAGMSANDYMSTVTSFSASLLQSLNNDTALAAEYANKALIDMSDNANKMGTDMAAIQNAYQGFAKQNYTMLDNLKLGYGGTATEMQRLIADAAELSDTVDAQDMSFDNIVEAIHVVQDEMGITGTTMNEASETISGSIAATKAAWSNLVTGIADENADLKQLFKNFTDSASTALSNIVPRVKQIIDGLSDLADEVPVIGALADVITLTAIVMGAMKIGSVLQTMVTGFQMANVQLGLYTLANGKAALATGALTGALTLKEIAVGVLTGQISLATAAQYAWNAAMESNPYGLAIAAISAMAVGVAKVVKEQKNAIAEIKETYNTLESSSQRLDEVKTRMAELEEIYNSVSIQEWNWFGYAQEYADLAQELKALEEQYAKLAAEEAAAAEAAAQPVARFKEATEQYATSATELLNKFQETYTQIADAVGGWFEPFEVAASTVQTSVEEMMNAMQSQIDFNASYTENLQALKTYGLGALSEAFQSYGADGAAYAATIVKAVEEAGGATSEGGQEIINNFLGMNEQVQGSQEELAQTMTLFSGEFDTAIEEMTKTLEGAIEDLNMGTEAHTSAIETIGKYIAGVNETAPDAVGAMYTLGVDMINALQSGLGDSASFTISFSGAGTYKTGLDYVPYDEFPAILHEGEAVLTKEEATAWRTLKNGGDSVGGGQSSGGSSGGAVVNQYIYATAQTPVELASATAAYFEQARWAT